MALWKEEMLSTRACYFRTEQEHAAPFLGQRSASLRSAGLSLVSVAVRPIDCPLLSYSLSCGEGATLTEVAVPGVDYAKELSKVMFEIYTSGLSDSRSADDVWNIERELRARYLADASTRINTHRCDVAIVVLYVVKEKEAEEEEPNAEREEEQADKQPEKE
ncbi:PREDICTED: uncharacterized protein LOC106811708 [Priapulus caudatus]|uniref:Uncharacterized protein LOC106811708 n=1 Tax=Priapulus caudatus TaxID=37621 RepID=A0ABM1EFD1_PRICU|nr:PREDICTED: uncharacterized protein LOC106811708 [Priapulus caudatus]